MRPSPLGEKGSTLYQTKDYLKTNVRILTNTTGLPLENPLLFYVRRAWQTLSSFVGLGLYWLWLERMRKRIQRDPFAKSYTDAALTNADLDDEDELIAYAPVAKAA